MNNSVHGVSGAGRSTTVRPAAKAGASLAKLMWLGTFHGVIAATTPIASRSTQRRIGALIVSLGPKSVSQG